MKFLSTFITMLVCCSAVAAETVNVADHGIVPGKDMSQQVNALLETLKGKKEVALHFPKGQYEFFPEQAIEKYRAVTNHDNSLKRMAFPLFGFENFTLDGGGSTFVFHGRICFMFRRCCFPSNAWAMTNITGTFDSPRIV